MPEFDQFDPHFLCSPSLRLALVDSNKDVSVEHAASGSAAMQVGILASLKLTAKAPENQWLELM